MNKIQFFSTTEKKPEKESRMTSSHCRSLCYSYLIVTLLALLFVGCGRGEAQTQRAQDMPSQSQPVQSERTLAQLSTDASAAALQTEHTREPAVKVSDLQTHQTPEYHIQKADDDNDGYQERRAYFLPGSKYPAKMGYDYTRDGKDDFYVTVSPSGELLALEIDRETWPIDETIHTYNPFTSGILPLKPESNA